MELFAPRYMTRFSCIGPRCEDSCCHDWGVIVDREHYDMLREKMASEEDRAEFESAVRPIEGKENDPDSYALMVLQDDHKGHRNCAMLGTDGLCKVHGRYGEEFLSHTCSSYPRNNFRVGNRAETVGCTSCPEIARLVLLADDSMEMVPTERSMLGRGLLIRVLEQNEPENYHKTFQSIRGVLLGLTRAKDYPLSSRLLFLAFFADKARDWLRKNEKVFEAQQLFDLIRGMRDANVLDALQEQFEAVVTDAPFAYSVVRELLTLPSKTTPASLLRLTSETFAQLNLQLDSEAEELQARFEQSAVKLSPRLRASFDGMLERYVQQYILRDWYIMSPSLIQYVVGLCARVAIVRFLVLGHPSMQTIAALEDDASVATLEALTVRTVYSMSRMLEHDAPLAEKLLADLEDQQMTHLSHAICLIKLGDA